MRQFFLVIGTLGAILLVGSIIWLIVFHQRKIIKFNRKLKRMEQERQQILLNASIQFQEEERNRIAADLHDDAGPLLATARLYLSDHIVDQDREEQLETVSGARQIIDDAIMLIRGISHNLMPPTLKNFGLESATVDIFQKINNSGAIKATAKFTDYRKRLHVEAELHIFRILQELVNNIVKHAQASRVDISLNKEPLGLSLTIKDNGKGIDFDHIRNFGNGLKNMKKRMEDLGIEFSISNDNGTLIRLYRQTIF